MGLSVNEIIRLAATDSQRAVVVIYICSKVACCSLSGGIQCECCVRQSHVTSCAIQRDRQWAHRGSFNRCKKHFVFVGNLHFRIHIFCASMYRCLCFVIFSFCLPFDAIVFLAPNGFRCAFSGVDMCADWPGTCELFRVWNSFGVESM